MGWLWLNAKLGQIMIEHIENNGRMDTLFLLKENIGQFIFVMVFPKFKRFVSTSLSRQENLWDYSIHHSSYEKEGLAYYFKIILVITIKKICISVISSIVTSNLKHSLIFFQFWFHHDFTFFKILFLILLVFKDEKSGLPT